VNLKEKMKQGPVFGIAVFTSAACTVETLGNWGFDFAYLDLEHTPMDAPNNMERLIMAARLAGISPIVRTTGADEIEIRKLLEMGAEGVAVPHVRTKADAEACVRAAKFPPIGRRGTESNVRAAGFGGPGFSWEAYIREQNEDTLVIPMDEDFEFTDNLEAILSTPGVDAVNFGPIDYALSCNLPIQYKIEAPRVVSAFDSLVQAAKPKGIGVMCPVVPAAPENVESMIAKGVTMLILGNDMHHLGQAFRRISEDVLAPRGKLPRKTR